MADEGLTDAQKKAEERERKRLEVRKRLEESGKAGKKAKKGFLTPERKKKLRKLLMFKAAEDLKRQQLQKDQERQKHLQERTIPLPNVDSIDDKGKLEQIYNDLFDRVRTLEGDKYDINQVVLAKENEINNLNIEVNDLRGKFAKPVLKKVSKYDNKFKKMATTAETNKGQKADFRGNLKVVKKENNAIDEALNKKKKEDKPEWSKKGGEKKEEKKEEEEAKKPQPEAAAEEEEVSEAQDVEEEEDEEEEEEE